MKLDYESVQLALFLTQPSSLNAIGLWQTVFDHSPEGFQSQQNGQSQAQGTVAGVLFNLIVQPSRVDRLINAVPPAPPALPPGLISDIDAAIDLGLGHAKKLSSVLQMGRVAAVLQANVSSISPADAVEKVKSFFPSLHVPERTTNVNIEMAVPKSSDIKTSRRLMRVSRWQTVQAQVIQVHIGGPPPPAPQPRFAAHRYVDVFMEEIEQMSEGDVGTALEEVLGEAKRLMQGGPDAYD